MCDQPENRIQRRAQFVRERGEEVVLDAAGLLDLGVRPSLRHEQVGTFQRLRRLAGQERGERAVTGAQLPRVAES